MDDSSPNDGPLAFGDFLEYLRRQGFTIGVGDYLRLQQLLNKIAGDCRPSDLKTLLCPILATNKIQQEQFYTAFDTYFELFRASSKKRMASPSVSDDIPVTVDRSKPKSLRKWPYVLTATILIMIVVILAHFASRKSVREAPSAALPNAAEPVEQPQENSNTGAPPNANVAIEGKKPLEATAKPDSPNRRIAAPPATTPKQSFYQRYGSAIHLATIVSPLLLFLIYEWYRFNNRKLMLEKQRGKKPPFVWPLKVEAPPSRLYEPDQLYRAARLMRRRQIAEFSRLDVGATVAATIASLGYPNLKYRLDRKPPEYLALIDRASSRDHQAGLFSELASALDREGLFIDRYFYDGDPRVCRNATGDSFHLLELLQQHGEHRLLIFGNGERVVNPVTGRLEAWAATLSEWKERAVLTPEAPSRWGLNEITLAQDFILLPATLDGLSAVVDHFELASSPDLRVWRQESDDVPPVTLEQAGLVSALRSYLGEAPFQLLCACAVYPEMNWDLTLYLGSLSCMPRGLITEQTLVKLVRVPWLRSGSMPEELRWLLIRELDREKEKAIRSAIVALMEKDPPPEETIAADAYQLNLVVQRWLTRRERKARRQMLEVVKTLPQSRAVQDYTLLRFLESGKTSPVNFLLPPRLRKLFFRHGVPAFGARTGVRALGALILSAAAVLIYFNIYFPRTLSNPHATVYPKEDLFQRNIAARSNSGSCFDCHGTGAHMQDKCTLCHTTTREDARTISGFRPMIFPGHAREGIGCTTCHSEHDGRDIRTGLVRSGLCSDCHNDSYRIKSGDRAGSILGTPHGGTVGYPVVNGKWKWPGLSKERFEKSGIGGDASKRKPDDQFHSIHQLGRMRSIVKCRDCHSAGSMRDSTFRLSPSEECAKCHGLLISQAGEAELVEANCNTCHPEHGQSEDIERLVAFLATKPAILSSNPQTSEEGPRVALHIRDESQRDKAQEISDYLLRVGYLVPDIDNVGLEGPGYRQEQTEVRYFRLGKDQVEGNTILAVIRKQFGIANSRIRLIPPKNAGGPTVPRQFEIWFKSNPL